VAEPIPKLRKEHLVPLKNVVPVGSISDAEH